MLHLDGCTQAAIALPQLILLDLYLPDAKAGLSVLQTIKSHPLYQRIPLVVTSRSTNPADIKSVFTYAANSYIIKPDKLLEWRELLPQFSHWLSKERGA